MARQKKQKVEWSGMPIAEGQLKEIKDAILLTHESLNTIEDAKSNITEVYDGLHEKYGIPKRVFNALMKFSYFGNAEIQFKKDTELQEAWEAIEKVQYRD